MALNRLLIAALPCLFAATMAQASNIVDTVQVQQAMQRGAIIWDVRGTAEFKKGHLPGAVNIGDAGKALRNDNTEDFIAVEQIEKLLGRRRRHWLGAARAQHLQVADRR